MTTINARDPAFAGGAVGDGVVDDTTAIQAMIAALPASGGRLELTGGGVYKVTAPLNFDNKTSVMLDGSGALSGGAATTTRILYTGTGNLISARSTFGFTARDVWFQFNNAAHSGTLVDLGQSSALLDTQLTVFDRCQFGSGTGAIQGTGILVSTDKVDNISFNDCNFSGGQVAVRGKAAIANYSNLCRFNRCRFGNFPVAAVKNAGQAWSFNGCTWDNSGFAAGAYTHDIGATENGLSFNGCWFGDGTASGEWITFSGSGLDVTGCYIASGSGGIRISGNSNSAVNVAGNQFVSLTNGIIVDGTNNVGLNLWPNDYQTVSTRLSIVSGANTSGHLLPLGTAGNFEMYGGHRTVPGVVSDASFVITPIDGTIAVDTTNNKIYVRIGGAWKSVLVA